MPNHITNWVEIKHDSKVVMDEFKKATFVEGFQNTEPGGAYKETSFDFNGIVDMPKELLETSSPTDVVDTQEEADKANESFANAWSGDQKVKAITKKEALRRTKKYGGTDMTFGDKTYGILNWYDFAYKHWGTKWGAYNVELLYTDENTLVLKFDTAWSSPTPIFDKLVEAEFTVNCIWQDEDPSNQGEYGSPYDVFDIYQPQLDVEYTK